MEIPTAPFKTADTAAFFRIIKHPVKFKLFLLQKIPAAFFSGLVVKEVAENSCTVTVPFKWFTQNPFHSTYFACLSMAAEMSTGILAMAHIYQQKPAVSMLVTAMESRFYKKAVGITTFICNDGATIKEAIAKAHETLSPQTVQVASSGCNEKGDIVAAFTFTWSFKVK